MSNYPDGMRGSYDLEGYAHCPTCDESWSVALIYDLGSIWLWDDCADTCPNDPKHATTWDTV